MSYYMKWFKTPTDKYDDPRMKMLRSLENGNIFALILDMLYTMAARNNANGIISLTDEIPYTESMLGSVLGFETELVVSALDALEMCGYIGRKNGFIFILDWHNGQFSEWKERRVMKEQEEKKKEQKEKNQKKEKKEKKTEQERETERETEAETETETEAEAEAERDCEKVQSLYSGICISYPRVEVFSDSHKAAIKKLLKKLPIEKIKLCFEKAEESDFLKTHGFVNFDWLIKTENAIKVLNGNYRNDVSNGQGTDEGILSSFATDEFINAALSKPFDNILQPDDNIASAQKN